MHAVSLSSGHPSMRSDSPASVRRAPDAEPPDDYTTVQRVGREFAREYFGRLNATGRAGSVADMFADRARFYAMDAQESRPAVGRAAAIEALRRFCREYGGRGGDARRCVTVLSMDAREDDDDDRYCGCGGSGEGGRVAAAAKGSSRSRFELFVCAEWTSPAVTGARRLPAPSTPFVQTFRVRCPRGHHGPAADHPQLLEILSTTVKTTTLVTVNPSPRSSHDFVHSEDTQNNIYPTLKIQSSDKIISSLKKQLNVRDSAIDITASTISSRPSTTTISSRLSATSSTRFSNGGVNPPGMRWSFGINGTYNKSHKRFPQYKEFETYQERVETFLKGVGNDLENNAPSARLCVDGLDAKTTADDLYEAFGKFGTVLWVRIVPAADNCNAQTAVVVHRQPNVHARHVGHVCFKQSEAHVGHVCFKETEALTRAMDQQYQAGGCFVRGICMPVRRFVEPDQ